MEGIKIAFWHWGVVAVLLILVEMFLPGAALIWLGVAAGATAVALLAFPEMGWQGQFAIFALVAIALVAASRLMPRRQPEETDQPHLNRRAEQYVGRTVHLESAISDGRGRAVVGDSLWTVTGPDLPAGSRVRVTGADGSVLRVEPESTPMARSA